MRRAAIVSLLVLADIGEAAIAHRAQQPDEFEFGKARIGNFQLTARTAVAWRGNDPVASEVTCTGDNQDIRFLVGAAAELQRLDIAFLGLPEADGDRQTITATGDALWLFLDGRRHELRNIPRPSERFTNHAYPPAPQEVMVIPWRGYRAVRSSESAPFMNISILHGDLLKARRLEWGFKSRNWSQIDRREPSNALPAGWQGRRYPIDNLQLRAAVEWCAGMVASEAARRLPSDFARTGSR